MRRISGTAAAALVAACSANPLEPGDASPRVPGQPDATRARVADVEIVAEADAWSGVTADLHDDVTPMRLIVRNESPHRIRLVYPSMAIVADDGTYYAALAPQETKGEAEVPITEGPSAREARFSRSYVEEPYRRQLDTDGSGWVYSPVPGYYDHYAGYWQTVSLPTAEMFDLALPEGVIEPGGQVAGFVYFEPVDDDHESATLQLRLLDAETDAVLGVAVMPFDVD